MIPSRSAIGNMYGRIDAIEVLKCIGAPLGCGRQLTKEIVATWPTLTRREYIMTGLCSKCQAEIYRCTCQDPCCEVDIGVGVVTCGSQHCPVHGLME